MDRINQINQIIEQTKELVEINSPSGYTKEAADYVMDAYQKMGYSPIRTQKGGILVELGGEDTQDAILIEAHIDTLGAMVAEIKANGRLRLSPVGGLNANNTEGENCFIITRNEKSYEGCFQLLNASTHVNGDYDKKERNFDEMEVVLDERVSTKEAVEALGIMVGDFVCFEPRMRTTKSGYIKSRFLDDKLSVGILLGFAAYVKEEAPKLKKKIYQHITVYEEVGHGGAASIPEDVAQILAVDMGCVGEGLSCDETMVSICAKDSRGPYDYEMVGDLVQAAKEHSLSFAIDIYPHYGSDADVALISGHDVKHGLIGPGVYASHGYERSHIDGVKNTFDLLRAYLLEEEKA